MRVFLLILLLLLVSLDLQSANTKSGKTQTSLSAVATNNTSNKKQINATTSQSWENITYPSEGYDIIGKLKPPPCDTYAMPAVLVPAVDMAGCMGKNVLEQIAPAYADNGADILGMGYTLAFGSQIADVTAKSWFRLASKFQNGISWDGIYKACSIEVSGEPYIGITISTGQWVPGEYQPNQWQPHKNFFARTCA
jgi:hypothetical protein